MHKELLSVEEFAETISVSPRTAKNLIARGDVVSVKIGDRRLIPAAAVRGYVDRLVATAEQDRPGR